MAQRALSLVRSFKGQIVIEALFVLAFLLSFLILLQKFHVTARQQIQQERLPKQKIKKQAPWIKRGEK